jgi:TolB-like protein
VSTKLTTIVAIDVDDYSALAAADAAGAVAAVERLVERCRQAAEAHSGRVFDTSGDSVLMEFANASSAVHAASELVANPDPPIRAAVHLGEVSQMPSGDLLGHGVTVAGKLQTQARRGRVVVSEPAWRALRGPLARRCQPKGSIKYDKTDQNVRFYELMDEGAGGFGQRQTRLLIAGGAAVVALALLALILWPLLRTDPAARAAILPLTASNEAMLQGLANGIAEDITLAAEAQQLNPIARPSTPAGGRDEQLRHARQAGAPLALEGAVERVGSTLRIVMNLTRTADGATLWSQTFEGEVADAPLLRHRAAITSADVLGCGVKAAREPRAVPDDATLALLLGACSQIRDPERLFDARETWGQVAARAPNLSLANAMLALAHARVREAASNSMREQLRTEARAAAERALRRDRGAGEAYLALDMTERRRGWDVREGILQRGLEHAEHNADLNARYSAFLMEVGRSDEALARARNASTLDPLSLEKRYAVAGALLHTGDTDAARDLVDEEMRSERRDRRLWPLRFRLAFWRSAAGDASALLEAPDSQVRSTRARQCWRDAIAALRSTPGGPARTAAVRRVLVCSRDGDLPAGQSLMLLSQLGALDDAFALARTHFVDEQRGGEEVLFSAATRPMRTDPRFMPLTRDLGLLGYWRLSHHWPDFCREPSLPYRCQAEAQRLL